MAAYVAALTLDGVRACLNDQNGSVYTDLKLMPLLKLAIESFFLDVNVSEHPASLEQTPTPQLVVAGSSTTASPSRMVLPVWLEERGVGETGYIPIIPTQWDPSIVPGPALRYWTWRGENIHFPPANVNREVRITYINAPLLPTDGNSPINVRSANLFLTFKTAYFAAKMIKRDHKIAEDLNAEAGRALALTIKQGVKGNQLISVRRIPFGTARRLFRTGFRNT